MTDKQKGCLGLLSIPFFLLLGTLAYAWAAQTLWAWFVVPLGAPAISLAHAYGLCALLWMLTNHSTEQKKTDDGAGAAMLKLAAVAFARPLFSVGAAWLVRWAAS